MSEFEPAMPASLGDAKDFHDQAIKQLDAHMLYQDEAKEAMVLAMAGGFNIALVGEPGGGKTMLLRASSELVEDLHTDEIAKMPILADLKPELVTGGVIETVKELELRPFDSKAEAEAIRSSLEAGYSEEEAKKHLEISRIAVNGLIHGGIRVIKANEINRINPFARNAMLEAYETGEVDRVGGTEQLDLLYTVATMNPGDKRQGVFSITPAEASRHAIGVPMGNERDLVKRRDAIRKMQSWEATPVKPVVNGETLHAIRALIKSQKIIPMPDSLEDKEFVDIVIGTQSTLREYGVDEADNRLSRQITDLARGMAALGAEDSIRKEHLHQAARFVIGARVGMLTLRDSTVVFDRIDSAVEQALSLAA